MELTKRFLCCFVLYPGVHQFCNSDQMVRMIENDTAIGYEVGASMVVAKRNSLLDAGILCSLESSAQVVVLYSLVFQICHMAIHLELQALRSCTAWR
jgi:hypothetical protein